MLKSVQAFECGTKNAKISGCFGVFYTFLVGKVIAGEVIVDYVPFPVNRGNNNVMCTA